LILIVAFRTPPSAEDVLPKSIFRVHLNPASANLRLDETNTAQVELPGLTRAVDH
jgi:hypothetical protein